MKKIFSSILMITIFFCSMFRASALTSEVDPSSGMICISGTTTAETRVTLLVLKEGKTADDLADITPQQFMAVVDYIDETISNEIGDFSFRYYTENREEYTRFVALVNERNMESQISNLEFSYYTNASTDSLVRKIVGYTEAKEVYEILTAETIDILGLETTFYDTLSQSQQYAVCKEVADLTEGGSQDIWNAFFESSLLNYLNDIKTTAGMADLFAILSRINKMNDICGFDLNLELYQKMGEKNVEVMSRLLTQLPVDSLEKFQAASMESLVLTAMKLFKYTYTKGILTDYNDILKLDLSKMTPKNETTVCKGLAGVSFRDIKSLQDAYNGLVSDDKSSSGSTSGTSSASSSGGKTTGGSFSGAGSGSAAIAASVPSQEDACQYRDLPQTHYAYDAVLELSKKNVITGYPDGTFGPDKTVSRAEFIKMLVSAFSLTATEEEAGGYVDLHKEDWYYPYVTAALANSVIHGISGNEIGAERFITREDVCVMLHRTLQTLNVNLSEKNVVVFQDADQISDYAVESVTAFAGAGIIVGEQERFAPKNRATRAECAQIIFHVLAEVLQ